MSEVTSVSSIPYFLNTIMCLPHFNEYIEFLFWVYIIFIILGLFLGYAIMQAPEIFLDLWALMKSTFRPKIGPEQNKSDEANRSINSNEIENSFP